MRKKAFEWFRKAAEQGLPPAQFNLGNSYRLGEGVKMDKSRAVGWYRKAAEQGMAEAQCNLALCYSDGEGVERDAETFMYWLDKSAAQDSEMAATIKKKCGINHRAYAMNAICPF